MLDGIAGIYFQISNYPESLSYIHRQLEAAQRIGDKRRIANAYNNLAVIYLATGEAGRRRSKCWSRTCRLPSRLVLIGSRPLPC